MIKNAKGDKLYLSNDRLLVSDKTREFCMNFHLEKKSLDKDQSNEIKKSTLIALFEEKNIFMLKALALYQIIDGKTNKIIENDKDWGKIVDLVVFNGNIYLLDQGKDQIWKYMVAESGFGSKNSYFQSGQSVDCISSKFFEALMVRFIWLGMRWL